MAGGCATVPDSYKPACVGNIPDAESVDGLQLAITADHPEAKIGDLLTFSVKIKNVGQKTVWIPESPKILLTWIYPDGRHDNFIQDDSGRAPATKLIPLGPGSERAYRTFVSTGYFDHSGITEFRARVQIPPPAILPPNSIWAGDMASNGFGVLLAN